MKIKKNYIIEIGLNFFITFFMGVGLFLINRYFALYLGSEKLGLMKLFTQLLAYLNLAEMGVAAASTYALYKPLVDKNYKEISIIMSTISTLYNKILIFVLIVGIVVTPGIPFFIKDSGIKLEIYFYWILYVISTVGTYAYVKYSILFMADQRFKMVRIIQGVSKIFIYILQIIVLIYFRSFFIFILLLIFESVIQYIFYKIFYNIFYKNKIFQTLEIKKEITKDLKNLFWHKFAGMIVFNTDLVLISSFISLETVAVYSSYLLLEQMISTVINVFLGVLNPKIGLFIAKNNKEDIFNYWKKLNILFLFLSVLLSFSFYRLSSSFIFLWMGEKYLLPTFTLYLISINAVIKLSRGVTESFKSGSGFFDDIYLPISEAGINFIFSIILVFFMGLDGVILGTVISNVIIICVAKPILVFKRCFDKSTKDYFKVYGSYVLLVFFSISISNAILKMLTYERIINNWIAWIKFAVQNSLIIFLVSFVVFLLDRNFRKMIILRK